MTSGLPSVLHIHFWADIRNTAGSVEKVITAFATHGERYAHSIACCPAERGESHFILNGVSVYSFYENRVTNRLFNKMLRLGAFTYPSLVKLIRQLRPSILHFHNRQELVDSVVGRLDYRPAVVVHYHRHFAYPVIPESADLLLFVSERTREYILCKTGSSKPFAVVPNPLSLELQNIALTAPTNPPHRPPVILFGGGASPLKGGKELIEAFAKLAPGRAKLVLAGNGVENLPGLPHPFIEVWGRLPANEFMQLMSLADIVAMPSFDEPFGLIAQEAMALGKLLLVSETGGLAEFTGPDCAVTVDPRDPQSLQQGLSAVLSLLEPGREHDRQKMLANARLRVATFHPERVTRSLESAYDDALLKASHQENCGTDARGRAS